MHKLDDYLLKNNISVADFAAMIGVHRISVYDWLAGRCMPRKDNKRAIIKATGGYITAEDLL
jgi:DNA-binding transcriptional regulator YdaS (Cro superfamily)